MYWLRLNLITYAKNRKLIICHYKNVCEDNTSMLKIIESAVHEIEQGNFQDVIGLVENKDFVRYMKSIHGQRVGDEDLWKI